MQIQLFIRANISLLILQTGFFLASFAQELPFQNEIAAFKKQDSLSFPPKNAILFIGSSSFTMWRDVQDYFPGYTIINRGFGGSSLPDVIRYVDEIVFPYQPRQIVVYCGENDLAASDTLSAVTVLKRFQQLFKLIRKKLPRASVVYVSMKPSPVRSHLFPKFIEANRLIRNYLRNQSNTNFVDVYNKMLTRQGKPDESLFLEDRLHMKEKGYRIWASAIGPYLIPSRSGKKIPAK